MAKLFCLFTSIFFLLACATSKINKAETIPSDNIVRPSWLPVKPKDENNILYEIGVCSKTFHRKDAIQNAFEDALSRLSKRFEVRVNSVLVDIISDTGEYTDRSISVRVNNEVSDVVLYGAELYKVFYDEQGIYGEKEATYVLIRWSESKLRETLNEILKEYKTKLKELDSLEKIEKK